MIRFRMPMQDGRAVAVAGITRENLRRLEAGQVLVVKLDDLARADGDDRPITEVAVVFKETAHDLMEEFAPMIGRDTEIRGSLREADGAAPESEEPRG